MSLARLRHDSDHVTPRSTCHSLSCRCVLFYLSTLGSGQVQGTFLSFLNFFLFLSFPCFPFVAFFFFFFCQPFCLYLSYSPYTLCPTLFAIRESSFLMTLIHPCPCIFNAVDCILSISPFSNDIVHPRQTRETIHTSYRGW